MLLLLLCRASDQCVLLCRASDQYVLLLLLCRASDQCVLLLLLCRASDQCVLLCRASDQCVLLLLLCRASEAVGPCVMSGAEETLGQDQMGMVGRRMMQSLLMSMGQLCMRLESE